MNTLLRTFLLIGGVVGVVWFGIEVSDFLKKYTQRSLGEWIGVAIGLIIAFGIGSLGLNFIGIGLETDEVAGVLAGLFVLAIAGFVILSLFI